MEVVDMKDQVLPHSHPFPETIGYMVRRTLRVRALPRSTYVDLSPRRSPYFPDIGAFLFLVFFGAGRVQTEWNQ